MLLAIFIVPLIYLLNAFFIGRLIKRFKISVNPFMCTIIGFFAFFTIAYFFDIFIYTANGNVWTYLIIFSIIQSILLILYLINWKRAFITFSVDWKKIITFIVVVGFTVLISWLCLRDFNSQFGSSWIKTITGLPKPDLNNIITFKASQSDVITNFSAMNIFNVFWINCFNISSTNDCVTFCTWSWIICGAIIMGCIACWIYPKNQNNLKVFISGLVCLGYLTLILAFIESFAVCDTWIMLLTFIYVLVLIKKETNSSLKLFFVTILLFSFLAINCTSLYAVICLWLFSVYWAIRNKENSVNYFVCLSWPIIIIVFIFASFSVQWLFALGSAITFVFMITTVLIFSRRGSPVWSVKFARSIAKNSGKVVYTFIGIILAAILVANFFIFNDIYHWSGAKIDYKNFLTFTYKYIWSIQITSDLGIALINSILYSFFLALIIMFIVLRNMKKSRLYPTVKNDSSFKLAVASAALFINPLVIHVLNIAMSGYIISMPLNTLVLNILFVAPLFISLLRWNYNWRFRHESEWHYDWY